MAFFVQLLLLLFMYSNTAVNAQGLTVSIVSTPESEPFEAAKWIWLSCHVTGNTSSVTYNWTLICGSIDPPLVVSSFINHTQVGEFDVSLRSTPSSCQDMATCHARDESGNTGQATWRLGRVTGAGFWGSTNLIHNTSAFRANANGNIGIIHCHSSSNASNVGEWISPDGLDITRNFTDPFTIQFNNGPGYPSFNTFQLQNRFSQRFTSTYEGVYSCIVPDDEGVMQTLHLGIYSHSYPNRLSLLFNELGRYSESPLILNSPTTGLPPTVAIWGKGGELLSNGATYGLTTQLRDRKNSTFDNFLLIRQTMRQAEGLYQFVGLNAIDGTVQDQANGANVTRIQIFIVMHTVGGSTSITCTHNQAVVHVWTDVSGNTILNGQELTFQANDSIHHNIFLCYGITQLAQIKLYYLKFITNVPSDVLQVEASSDDSTSILGQSYSIDCIGHKTTSGLINSPTPQWYAPSGSLLSTDSDIQLQGPRNVGLSSTELVAQFPTLRSSHAGSYTCRVSLSSPARTSTITKSATFGITVQIPAPTVRLTVFSSEPHAVGGTLTIHCEAVVSNHINTPVSVDFTWRRTGGKLTSTFDSRVNISETTAVNSHTYLSILTLSDLGIGSDSNQNYWCSASVRSTPTSEHILNSTSASSTNNYQLTVHAIGVTVSVTPSQLTVIDSPPSNSFTLTCTATSATNTSAEKVFSWSKRVLGSSSSTPLTDNGGSIIIVTSGDSSTLTTSETQSGGYVYNCSARIGDAEASSDTAIVSVRGPSAPVVATNIETTVTSFSTVTVAWSVSSISYTPETYTVVYGTSQSNLNQRSSAVSSVSDRTSYSVELSNLKDSTLYYFKVKSNNSVSSTESEVQTFEVHNASVIISIFSNASSPLAGDVVKLTCTVVELVDHSGDTTVTWKGPDGQTISSGGDYTITRQDTSQRVVSALRFNPLRVSHRGQYTCEASIRNVGYFDSNSFSLAVTPGILGVTIQSSGTGQVGTPHRMVCQIDLTQAAPIGEVLYEWTSTCSGECFVLGQSGEATVSTEYLKAADAGTHTCTVTDSVGNHGNASVGISTSGVALYHSNDGLLSNNSVLAARNGILQGSLSCLSGRGESGIGRWISPSGNDYTLPGNHPYDVSVGRESNPGVVEISVSGSKSQFPAGYWDGVYSCIIPDETGVDRMLYVGIYIVFGSPPVSVIQPLTATTMNLYPYFTLNCSSSGSAATEVAWTKDNQPLNIDGQMYGSFQILREGTSSSYDNLLVVYNRDMNENSGEYGCTVRNSFGSTAETATFRGIQVSEHGVFSLGSALSITCSSDYGVSSVEWLQGKQVVSMTEGSAGELRIGSVSESEHGRQYTCRATSSFGVQEHNITIHVEVDPESALEVSITTSSDSPVKGSSFILTCTATKSQYLTNTPTIEWYDGRGNRIVTDGGIRLGLLVEPGDGTVLRTLTFLSLESTHSMEYKCNATVRFNPRPYVTTKQAIWALAVGGTNQTDQNSESPPAPAASPAASPALYLGAGVGGGLAIVVLFVLIILVFVWWRRSRKLERRQREANAVMFNNSFSMTNGMSGAYRMSEGPFYRQGAGIQNPMMLPLHKFNNEPDLPPRNEFYMTPPNAYERSIQQTDSYTYMSSSAGQPKPPPPQYQPFSHSKLDNSDPFYAEIPADEKSDDDQPQDEYVSMSNGNKDETSEKSVVQEVYGN